MKRWRFPILIAICGAAALVLAGGCKKGSKSASASSPGPSASTPSEPATVQFVEMPAAIGSKFRDVRKSTLKLSVEFWQGNDNLGSNDSSRAEDYSRTFEVAGLVGGDPAKGTLHYDHYHLSEIRAEQPPHTDSSVEGKTYLLDITSGKLVVAAPDGKPVPPDERETIERLHADFGQDDPVVAALGTLPIPVGKYGPLREPLFRALSGMGSQGAFKNGNVVISGVKKEAGQDAAVIDWTAEMTTDQDNGLTISWHLKGTTVVGLEPARTLSMTMSGDLDATGQTKKDGARVQLAGAGTVTDDRTITPL